MKKILIFGFPHTGTTILKSIIGHIPDVYEIVNEKLFIESADIELAKLENKRFVVCKYPFFTNNIMTDDFKEYYKIFVIRNPLYVYSSLNKRYKVKSVDHSNYKILETQAPLFKFSDTCRLFNWFKNKPPVERMLTIKYEEFFENGFSNIKKILDLIGLNYDDRIFDNSNYSNYSVSGVDIPQYKPDVHKHVEYRTWQINQPFKDNNIHSKINVFQEQIDYFKNCPHIQKIYPLQSKIYINT